MKHFHVPCSQCLRETAHRLLHETSRQADDRILTYAMLECCGCGDVCLSEQVLWTDDGSKDVSFFPPPVSRKEPEWLLSLIVTKPKTHDLGALLSETYQAMHGGQNRLAAMGIRALLEQLMISTIGSDQGSFEKNLSAFHDAGYVSLPQRDTLNNILLIGHRAFRPTATDLKSRFGHRGRRLGTDLSSQRCRGGDGRPRAGAATT